MFTGIISEVQKVVGVRQEAGGLFVEVNRPKKWKLRKGSSVSLNGICSTVVVFGKTMVFQYMPESVDRSNLGGLHIGDLVNLEQPLRLQDMLDGHMVQGHVDTVGRIASVKEEGNSRVFTIALHAKTRYIVQKGSICVEGISLTVVDVKQKSFTVKIIPHTWKHTNLYGKTVGDLVNIEFDILAKYIERFYAKKKK
ncbi:MAG TPA: riboflavin synthase [Patescibacteria group bacterium]|nr:riboflavin synthase [Patescibacteria group bacterium]